MANTSIGLCCRKVRERPKATPVPWGKILVLSAVLFVNQFGSNMIFPFLPFMVHDFFPELNRQEIGQKAGYLGSAFFIGNFAGSMTWGWLSDILGRRPVMLLGVCGTIFSELLFGFSQNFGWAVAGRFLWGLLNGNLGVVRTYVSEICDDTNQATGFAVVGTTAGMSRLLGSVAGGFLAQPASKYTALQVPFFCTFPYLLPCLVGAGISVLSLIVAYLFLDETLHTKKKGGSQREQEGASGQSDSSQLDSSQLDSSQVSSNSDIEMVKQDGETEDSDVEMQQLSGASDLIVESDIDSQSDYEVVSAESSDVELLLRVPEHKKHRRRWVTRVRNYAPSKVAVRVKERAHHYQKQCILCMTWCTHCKEECTPQNTRSFVVSKLKAGVAKLKTMTTLLRDRKVLLSTVLYGLTSCISITSNELFPLLMVTHHEHGGYRMDSSEIGVVLMVVGLCQPLWQILMFPRITKCFGYRWTFRLAVLVFAATFVLLPFSNQITGPVPGSNDTFSGSGSGSGLWNNTDYCGNDLNSMDVSVNENSVKRIPVYIWAAVIGIFVFVVVSRMTSLTSSMVLVSNSTLPATRGTVNGIGQSAAALGRALGPMAGAPLFAWSADNGSGWPLNFHFVFDLLAVLALLIAAISLILPKTIEKKRDTVDKH